MPYTGEKPGPGTYECDACCEIMILTNNSDELPPCPYCNTSKFVYVGCIDGEDPFFAYQYDLYSEDKEEAAAKRFYSGYF